jgi:hypothetical protein
MKEPGTKYTYPIAGTGTRTEDPKLRTESVDIRNYV